MTHEADVIVVGAGPAGSAAAAALARAGARVTLLERETFPRRKPCGDYLNPGCDAALSQLGVRDAVARAGARPVRGMRVVTPQGFGLTLLFGRRIGWSLQRETLDHVLLAHAAAAGARVYEGVRVQDVQRDRGQVRVAVARADGSAAETHTAALVVGADGLRSTVARLVGAGAAPRRGRYAVGAYLENVPPVDAADGADVGEVHLRVNQYCCVAHQPGGLANVTIALSRAELRSWRGAVEARYWAALRTFPALADRLTRARRAGAFAAIGPLAYWRRRSAADGVLLVGDAAAYVDPLTGQGVYLALRGAALAADAALRALDRGGPRARTLRRYERERRREFGGVFAISRILQALAFQPAVVARATRRMAAHPELGAALIAAVGNAAAPASVLRPGFIARTLGLP